MLAWRHSEFPAHNAARVRAGKPSKLRGRIDSPIRCSAGAVIWLSKFNPKQSVDRSRNRLLAKVPRAAKSPSPVSVSPSTTVGGAMELVTQRRFRHLPIVENGKVLALVSSGDLTHWPVKNQIG